jgi:sugar/nucleoside kinase (ribokinase family)
VAVVGHVEWVEFALVPHVPRPGEIVHTRGTFSDVAGGGSVAAVQHAKLAGACTFFTALGDDELGRRAAERLEELGVTVRAAFREGHEQRRGFTFLDDEHERTITVIGERMGPRADDDLPWHELEQADAVYLTSGDAGAVRLAREAKVLVATARALAALHQSGVRLDALVASAKDPGERFAHDDLHAIGRGDDAVGFDGEVRLRRFAGAVGGAFEDEVPRAALRKAGAVNFQPIAGLDLLRRELGDFDERRRDGSLAAGEQCDQEEEDQRVETHGLLLIQSPR